LDAIVNGQLHLPADLADTRINDARTVAVDIQCRGCDYNLRGLSPDGNCPECGMHVTRTLYPSELVWIDRQVLDDVESAATMVHRFFWVALVGVFVVHVVYLGVLVALRAIWLLTPASVGTDRKSQSRRRTVRLLGLGAVALMVISLAAILRATSYTDEPRGLVVGLMMLAQAGWLLGWWTLIVLVALSLRNLMRGIGDTGLADQVQTAITTLIVAGLVAGAASLLTMGFELSWTASTPRSGPPIIGDFGDIVRIGAFIVAVAFQCVAFYRMVAVSGNVNKHIRESLKQCAHFVSSCHDVV
jgi:hypothetical protein